MIVGSRTTEELGGPLRIAQMSGEIAKDGVVPLIWFTAVLSVNLGLINLFPIPMLDGGHLVMYAVEALRGRPLDRAQPGGGVPLRPGAGADADGVRDLERPGAAQRDRVLQGPGLLGEEAMVANDAATGGTMAPRLAAWVAVAWLVLGALGDGCGAGAGAAEPG